MVTASLGQDVIRSAKGRDMRPAVFLGIIGLTKCLLDRSSGLLTESSDEPSRLGRSPEDNESTVGSHTCSLLHYPWPLIHPKPPYPLQKLIVELLLAHRRHIGPCGTPVLQPPLRYPKAIQNRRVIQRNQRITGTNAYV